MLMKKRALAVVVLLLLLVAGGVWVVLSRPEVPQRDYLAEYEVLRAGRFTGTAGGADAWEALAAQDRGRRILDIKLEAIQRASDAERANGVDPEQWFVPRSFADSLFDGHDYLLGRVFEEGRPVADRLFRSARAEALPRVMELLEHSDTRAAMAAALEHEMIVAVLPRAATLLEIDRRSIMGANWSALPDQLVMRYAADPAQRLDGFRLLLLAARIAGTDPSVIGVLKMRGTEGQAIFTLLYELVDGGAFSPVSGQLRPHGWVEALQRHMSLRPDRGWFMQGQRLEVLDALDAIYRDRPGSSISSGIPLVTTPVVGVPHHRLYSFVNEYFDLADEAAGQWPDQRTQTDIDPATMRQRVGSRGGLVLDALFSFSDIRLLRALDLRDAELMGALALLGVLAYQADHDGEAPASLDALVPRYLDAVPTDPFSAGGAEPLVYRVDAEGSVWLYSRGPDLTDNGGVRASGERDPGAGDDLVFWPRP